MTIEGDDGHGPRYGCTYNKCGNPNLVSQARCPFVKDDIGANRPTPETSECWAPMISHEWRQYWVVDDNTPTGMPYSKPDGFYCIHCRTTTT